MSIYYDNFTAANGTQLDAHTADSGESYSTNAAYKIHNNRLYRDAGASHTITVNTYTTPSEYDLVIDAHIIDASGNLGIIFCASANNQNGYLVRIANGELSLWERNSGTFTKYGSEVYTPTGSSPIDGQIKIEVRTADIKVYWDNDLKITYTDTTHARAGYLHYYATKASSSTAGIHFDSVYMPNVGLVTETDTAYDMTPFIFDGTVLNYGSHYIYADTGGPDASGNLVILEGANVGTAVEIETAYPIRIVDYIDVGIATETNTAQIFFPSPLNLVMGIATETQTANLVEAKFTTPVEIATEADIAYAIQIIESVSVGIATEISTALSVPPFVEILVDVGTAAEADTAASVSPVTDFVMGIASTTEQALAFTIGPTVLTQADIDNIVNALFSRIIENGETFEQQLRLIRAEAAGHLTVSGNQVGIRDAANTKDRITATTDSNGQRLVVTTDPD